MTPDEVLELVRSRGVTLWAGPSGRLGWQCAGPLPDDLRQLLLEHKPALLALLPPPWDQVEADQLLGEARAALARVEARYQAGRVTAVHRNVIALCVEVCEQYARGHELEARRGWDAMALLRGAVRRLLGAATTATVPAVNPFPPTAIGRPKR
jgi:hypothetical protein